RYCLRDRRPLHSFPTRRSSDLFSATPFLIHRLIDEHKLVRHQNHLGHAVPWRPGGWWLWLFVFLLLFGLGFRLDNRRFGDVLQRSEEHTSELQSRENLVCRLLL